MNKQLLTGKVAVVTGGTRGIGAAIVRRFVEHGATVVFFGSRPETAREALASLRRAYPDARAEAMSPDLSDGKQIAEVCGEIVRKYGKLDIWVNNAGISAREPLYDYTDEAFDRIMDLNVKAAFIGAREAAKVMKGRGGAIINTSSMVGTYGQPSGCGYPTSKFAVNGMTKSLARELGRDGIRVNAVAPGVTDTDMVRSLPKALIDPLIATIPMGRVGSAEEVADAFVFLASDMASYITGAVLPVDGAAQC